MKQLKALIMAAAALVAAQTFATTEAQIDKIRERIKPVGEVCIGAECGGAAVVASGPRSGEEVYNGACTACHGAGILGAPKTATKRRGMNVWRKVLMSLWRWQSKGSMRCHLRVTVLIAPMMN